MLVQQEQPHHNMDTTALQVLCLLQTQATLLSLLLRTRNCNRRNRAVKRRKDGRLRKARIGNRDRKRSIMNRHKLQALPDNDFYAGARMPRDKFEQLLAKLTPVLLHQKPRQRRLPKKYAQYDRHIDPYIALAFTLRWLGGGQRWDLMYAFDIASTTFHVWKWRVIKGIIVVLRDNILFPTTAAGLDSLAAGFANIGGGMGAAIPHTVCAFDGVVIQKCPPPQAKLQPGQQVSTNTAAHFYRKGYFGAAVLAFVDAKCRLPIACANVGPPVTCRSQIPVHFHGMRGKLPRQHHVRVFRSWPLAGRWPCRQEVQCGR